MIKYPENPDLRRQVRFSAENGTIWLGENRMLLVHAAALSSLRKELVNSLGQEQTRRIFTRMGHVSGQRDAELAKKIRSDQDAIDAFVIGPQLHMLEGSVNVTPVKIEMDILAGKFFGELRWDNSWEAEAHVKQFGPQSDPVCWMLIGYASGYTSAFMGRTILFKEVQCTACGAAHCSIIGKPVEEWPDAGLHLPDDDEDPIVPRRPELRTQADVLPCSRDPQRQVESMIGSSPAFLRAYDLVSKAANTLVNVLLTGETGVGKERFARAIHETSTRAHAPFVAVNCAAMPPDLVESELFGVEKGAFTGAHMTRIGKFERAEGGTLFLDEIGELPLAAQAKILRVLQEGEIDRLGDDKTRKVNVRIVAATNTELDVAVRQGKFRADLFYRLNVYPIAIPPLRERTLDIAPMVESLMKKFNALHNKRLAGITDKAMKALMLYHWPGNVRELANMIERGTILAAQDGWIELGHLFPNLNIADEQHASISQAGALEENRSPEHVRLCDAFIAARLSLDEAEAMLLSEAVERASGNLSGAARLLGITRPQLTYRLKRRQDAALSKD